MMHKTPYMKNSPKNIQLTENEEKLLRMQLEKTLGILITPQVLPNPKPSPWQHIQTLFTKPIVMALFTLVVGTSGIFVYQMKQLQKGRSAESVATGANTSVIQNNQILTDISDKNMTATQQAEIAKVAAKQDQNQTIATTKAIRKTQDIHPQIIELNQQPQPLATVMMAKMSPITENTSTLTSLGSKASGEEKYYGTDGYNEFTLMLMEQDSVIHLRYLNIIDAGKYLNSGEQNDYAATFKQEDIHNNEIILNVKNYRFYDPQEYIKVKLIFDENSKTIEWISLDEIAPYLPKQIILQKR